LFDGPQQSPYRKPESDLNPGRQNDLSKSSAVFPLSRISRILVEKESPSQSEQSIAGRGEYPLQGKIARQPMREARRIGADLSNLVLQRALNKMAKIH
jgi:hypothetical protein